MSSYDNEINEAVVFCSYFFPLPNEEVSAYE